jgi:hypothetical protein
MPCPSLLDFITRIIMNTANYEPPHHALLSPLITSILQNPNISLLRHFSNTLYIQFQGSIPFHTQQQVQVHYGGIPKCDVEWCGWSAPDHAT